MRDYGKVNSSFWTSESIRSLSDDGRMLSLLKREGPGIYGMDKENTTLALSVAELEKEIHRAYFAGLKKGREQGGLEPLFEGEEV
ncbi:hypothetical protein VQZ33_001501 [Salmonella enterica]|nr:hypothetical protein [Salmonella enterica]EHN5988810.1 hypothetical protein [Salmonella enterica]EMD2985902.1 hypothetical protein [Salmonella enterica]EMD3056746.1 hypothetical protein [Salmonella enterica]EMD3064204.1 hypothetical protein [Salmonella enterica]